MIFQCPRFLTWVDYQSLFAQSFKQTLLYMLIHVEFPQFLCHDQWESRYSFFGPRFCCEINDVYLNSLERVIREYKIKKKHRTGIGSLSFIFRVIRTRTRMLAIMVEHNSNFVNIIPYQLQSYLVSYSLEKLHSYNIFSLLYTNSSTSTINTPLTISLYRLIIIWRNNVRKFFSHYIIQIRTSVTTIVLRFEKNLIVETMSHLAIFVPQYIVKQRLDKAHVRLTFVSRSFLLSCCRVDLSQRRK